MSAILAVNAGSSSLKHALFGAGDPPPRIESGSVDWTSLYPLGLPDKRRLGMSERPTELGDKLRYLDRVLKSVSATGETIAAVGHRVVHGGPKFVEPERVTPELLDELRRISPFDPEHLPAQVALMQNMMTRFPGTPQVACFDTAFHRDLPPESRILPIPRKYEREGVRRYGFHGLSYSFLVDQLQREPGGLPRRLVLAHLGNGASLAAVLDGRSIETTMGFTPTGGIPMSRRSGDLDPGLVAYLAQTEGMTPAQFNEMVNTKSGLLGISETSTDMRYLLEHEKEDGRAADAVAVFCRRVKQTIGAYAATLGGLDGLVFSGGIGEKSAEIRARVCDGLGFLGIEVDAARNAAHDSLISKGGAPVAVRVMKTDEEIQIARSVRKHLGL